MFENNTISETFFLEGEKKLDFFLKNFSSSNEKLQIALSSVGKLEEETLDWLKQNTDLIVITHKSSFPFKNLYATPTTLGIDRMVLSAGAVLKYPKQNRLVIDAGTCITYDFINDCDEYLGGAISPGLMLRYKSLNDYTEKLPLLKLENINYLIGNQTANSIHSGIVNGVTSEIDGIINEYQKKYPQLTIILTGGDTLFLAKRLKNVIFANSNFLLESMNTLYQYIIENDKKNLP